MFSSSRGLQFCNACWNLHRAKNFRRVGDRWSIVDSVMTWSHGVPKYQVAFCKLPSKTKNTTSSQSSHNYKIITKSGVRIRSSNSSASSGPVPVPVVPFSARLLILLSFWWGSLCLSRNFHSLQRSRYIMFARRGAVV